MLHQMFPSHLKMHQNHLDLAVEGSQRIQDPLFVKGVWVGKRWNRRREEGAEMSLRPERLGDKRGNI